MWSASSSNTSANANTAAGANNSVNLFGSTSDNVAIEALRLAQSVRGPVTNGGHYFNPYPSQYAAGTPLDLIDDFVPDRAPSSGMNMYLVMGVALIGVLLLMKR